MFVYTNTNNKKKKAHNRKEKSKQRHVQNLIENTWRQLILNKKMKMKIRRQKWKKEEMCNKIMRKRNEKHKQFIERRQNENR